MKLCEIKTDYERRILNPSVTLSQLKFFHLLEFSSCFLSPTSLLVFSTVPYNSTQLKLILNPFGAILIE